MGPEERHHAASARGRLAPKKEAIDAGAVVAAVQSAEKLLGWKQLDTKARIVAVATFVASLAALVLGLVGTLH